MLLFPLVWLKIVLPAGSEESQNACTEAYKDRQYQEENLWLKEKVDHRLSLRSMFREKYTVGSTDQIPQPSFEKWTEIFLFISEFRTAWDAVLVAGSVLELAADGACLRLQQNVSGQRGNEGVMT